jgi:glycosyltransferase involved in cell wall biosynthesis
MRFSLIVATLGRVRELEELLASLARQTCRDFEVIVVDQNGDDRLAGITARAFPFPLYWQRTPHRNSSRARNLGLRRALGELVAFPDDDCLYPPDLLAMVDAAFRDQPALGVRTGPAASSPAGGLGSGRWRQSSGPIGPANVWTSVIEFNMFLRREAATAVGGFDEQLGVGARFGSAEGNDLALRVVKAGWRGWYDTAQRAIHPDKALTAVAAERAFAYGAGLGHVLRKHNAALGIRLRFLLRPLGGCVLNLLSGRRLNARYYWQTLRGRLWGLAAG